MKQLKRVLALLMVMVTCLAVFPTFSVSTSAASYDDRIILDVTKTPQFVNSTWDAGDTVKIPFKLFSFGNRYQNYYVKIYNESGSLVASSDGSFSTSIKETDLTVTWDTNGIAPGTYYVKCYATYSSDLDDTLYPFHLVLPGAEAMHFTCVSSATKTAVNDNLKSPGNAWGYTKATLQEWSSDTAIPYTLRLEEMYTGIHADLIVEDENTYNTDPTGNQHWILMKFSLTNRGSKKLEANDVIYSDSFYTSSGASLGIIDTATFSGERSGMDWFDVEVYGGATAEFWVGILPQQNITFPYIRLNNGYNKNAYEKYDTWLKTTPGKHLKKVDGEMWYFDGSTFDNSYKGLFEYGSYTYFIKNGKVDYNANTLVTKSGKTYYVKYGKVDYSYTGFFKYKNEWWYIKEGVVLTGSRLVPLNGTLRHIQGGKLAYGNTLAVYNGVWYHVKNGKKAGNTHTAVQYNGKWHYVKNGKADYTYTGMLKVSGKWKFVKNGIVSSNLEKPVAAVKNTSSGVQVTWNKVPSATSYKVYRSTYSGGKWSSYVLYKNTTATSYVDKNVKSGARVRYVVYAYNSHLSSKASTNAILTYLAQPTVKLNNAATGVSVSWNKVTGAAGYKIYRSVYSGGKWSAYSLYKSTTATSYVDTKVSSGSRVRYTVYAFSGSSMSAHKTGPITTYLSPRTATVKKASTGVKVTWSKATGATGYIIYRRQYINGKWSALTKIKTTSALTYTDKTAKKGVSYQYTVRAYNGNYLSANKYSSTIKR